MEIDKIIDSVKIISMKYLCGPNIWNYNANLEVLIDIGLFEQYPSDKLPNFYENLKKVLPTLQYHRCNGGFLKRVKNGTYFGHILEHITLELQNYTGFYDGNGRTRETEISGIYKIVAHAGYNDMEVIKECFNCALDLLFKLIRNEKVELRDYMRRILALQHKFCGVNTNEILKNIPKNKYHWFKIHNNNKLYQLGYGKKMKRLWESKTSNTIGIGESISKNKEFTKNLLNDQGIIVLDGYIVNSIDDCYKYFDELNPVTIKPMESSGGRGVTVNINNIDDIIVAFDYAISENGNNEDNIIIEKYIPGDSYRITLIDKKVVACCKQYFKIIENTIVGNGIDSIGDMIDSLFAIELLENGWKEYKEKEMVIISNHYHKTKYIEDYLDKFEYNLDTILPNNMEFKIERKFDAYDMIDINILNPNIIYQCELATKIINLDVCGINIILNNITQPLTQNNGAIIDIKAGPSLGLHMNNKNSVGKELIKYLCKDNDDGYIPLFSITGSGNISYVNNIISSFFTYIGKYVGSCGINGIYLNGIKKSSSNINYMNVKSLLMNKRLEIAVVDNDSNVILNEGLFYNNCNAIILGLINTVKYETKCCIDEPHNSFKILRAVVDLVGENNHAILNKDDVNIELLTNICDGSIIYYGIGDYDNEDRAIVLEDNDIYVYKNKSKKKLCTFPNANIDMLAALAGIYSNFDLYSDDNIIIFNNFFY
jgi:cyanophycin synthetase